MKVIKTISSTIGKLGSTIEAVADVVYITAVNTGPIFEDILKGFRVQTAQFLTESEIIAQAELKALTKELATPASKSKTKKNKKTK